jgi:hypothetical protein
MTAGQVSWKNWCCVFGQPLCPGTWVGSVAVGCCLHWILQPIAMPHCQGSCRHFIRCLLSYMLMHAVMSIHSLWVTQYSLMTPSHISGYSLQFIMTTLFFSFLLNVLCLKYTYWSEVLSDCSSVLPHVTTHETIHCLWAVIIDCD